MKRPAVTVIIPVYNAEPYLRQCMDSVIGQTLYNIQIICVDDGSTDGSLEILQEYARLDQRILVFSQNNQFAGVARNKGLKYATGEYLSFLDADDFFENDMLELAYNRAIATNADIVAFYCNAYYDDLNRYEKRKDTVRNIPRSEPFAGTDVSHNIFRCFSGWAWDKLFKCSYVINKGLQFQDLRTSNDLSFVYLALAMAERIATVKKVLVHHRITGGASLEATKDASWECYHHALMRLRDGLCGAKVYSFFERDYINYCLHFSLWNLYSLNQNVRELLYNRLRNEWFAEYQIFTHGRKYYYNKAEYAEACHIVKKAYDSSAVGAKHNWLASVIWKLHILKYRLQWNTEEFGIGELLWKIIYKVRKK